MKVKGLCWWPCQCKLLSLGGCTVCQCNNAQFSLTHGTKAAEDTNTAHLHMSITDVQIYWIKYSTIFHKRPYIHIHAHCKHSPNGCFTSSVNCATEFQGCHTQYSLHFPSLTGDMSREVIFCYQPLQTACTCTKNTSHS